MLKNKKGDVAILFALCVSVAMFGFIAVLQMISTRKVKINISNVQTMESFTRGEATAWSRYFKKKMDDAAGVGNTNSLAQSVESIVGGQTIVTANSILYCGAPVAGAALCIKKKVGAVSGGDPEAEEDAPPAAVGKWTHLAGNAVAPFGTYGAFHWTGTKAIGWGGATPISSNSGGIFDPATRTLTPILNGGNTPSPRHWFANVWTGTNLIIWGGWSYLGGTLSPPGASYDPVAKTWTNISEPPKPASWPEWAASVDKAVWTGSKMIIWTSNNWGMGAAYNPTTNQWAMISSDHSSLPLYPATNGNLIWTGTEMIVWGGLGYNAAQTGVELSSRGARYNPTLDKWTPMANGPEAPKGRFRYTSVWTGTQMIVWGGCDNNYQNCTNTGGVYDPSANTWTSTSLEKAPSARMDHVAVWTGTHMVIWGGSPNGTPFNDGAMYDPVANSWTPLVVDDSTPSARSSASAIWTGKEMIVWGGYGLNDGGILDLKGVASTAEAAKPAVTLSQKSLTPGQYLVAHYSDFKNAYLGIYRPGAGIKEALQYHSAAEKTGDIAFMAPAVTGEYELRAYVSGGADANEVPITIPVTVSGTAAACGVGSPLNMPTANLSFPVANESYVIGKQNNQSFVDFYLRIGGHTAASNLTVACTGDTTDLKLYNFPTGTTLWKEVFAFEDSNRKFYVNFEPQSRGPKKSSCAISYCDGLQIKSLSFTLTGG